MAKPLGVRKSLLATNRGKELRIEQVTEGAVADIMDEACDLDEALARAEVCGVLEERGAGVSVGGVCMERVDKGGGEMGHAEGVLETVVTRAGEDVIRGAELFQIAQALNVRRVEDGRDQRRKREMSVDRIVDYARGRHFGLRVVERSMARLGEREHF